MAFLDERVFGPILNSPTASNELKAGVRITRTRMMGRDAKGMIHYFWSAVVGTERSRGFAARMRPRASTGLKRQSTSFESVSKSRL